MGAPPSTAALFEELRARRATAADLRRRAREAYVRSGSVVAAAQVACRPDISRRLVSGATPARPARSKPAPTRESQDEIGLLRVEIEHLRAALATRDVIWEAKLTVAAAVGCDANEAHRLLVEQSQHENRKLRDIATEIVQRRRDEGQRAR